MKAAEKVRQKLSYSQQKTANAKYNSTSKRWKINLSTVEDYLEYMEEDLPRFMTQ